MTPKLEAIKKDFPTFEFFDGGIYGDKYGQQISCVSPQYFLSIHDNAMDKDGRYKLLVMATSRQSNLQYHQYHDQESIKTYLTSVMIMGI